MNHAIISKVEAPKQELAFAAISRRGQERLALEMREPHWSDSLPNGLKKIMYTFFAKLGMDLAQQERRIAFQKALSLNQQSTHIHEWLGKTWSDLGYKREAKASYEQCLANTDKENTRDRECIQSLIEKLSE